MEDKSERWTHPALKSGKNIFLLRALITRQYKELPTNKHNSLTSDGSEWRGRKSSQTIEADSKPHQQAPAPGVSAWDTDVYTFFFSSMHSKQTFRTL